ncbi:MAG TPA: efflux RND transporter periplasmic adaptor subunit [Terriglobia bacterium]|nr:efflux RND transporter periplasmic adaptor subunit [Terriglobia bacterium]
MSEFKGRMSVTAKRAPRWRAGRLRAALPVALACLAPLGVLSVSCSSGPAKGDSAAAAQMAMMAAVPVTVAQAAVKTIPVEIQVIGNGEAYNTVNVKAQVDGMLQKAYFHDGEDVQQGQLLFTIDPRPFQASLDQAQAALARDEAQLHNAEDQFNRNAELFKEGIVSKDQYDTFQTNMQALGATVRADQAAIENARIQLGYCTIRSPIGGRTGSLLIKEGNLVKNNDAALVVINQISPLYVDFSVPEQYLDQVKHLAAAGPLQVEAVIPQDPDDPERGTLSFINNTVDTTSGTVLMKGTFPNAGKRLWPGQYVNVVLTLESQKDAVVVPTAALQTGPNGKYVYVVKPDKSVELRPVVPGISNEGSTVIAKGIASGETVVTDGQLRLYPNAKVEEKTGI